MGYWSELFGIREDEVTLGMIEGTESPPPRILERSEQYEPKKKKYRKMKTFLICPVRGHSVEETEEIVKQLEKDGWKVHWPPRDTNQVDPTGYRICEDNRKIMQDSDFVHFVWDGKSEGCLFDLGMAFALGKKIIPVSIPELTNGKSFQNMVMEWSGRLAGKKS